MLYVYRSDQAGDLAGALAELLETTTDDPLAAQIVAAPTRGVARWLSEMLALRLGRSQRPDAHDGITAGISFPSPRTLVTKTLAIAADVNPEHDPWTPERLIWPLLTLIDEHRNEPWLKLLTDHLRTASPDPDRPRRIGPLRHIARLYDRYATFRPQLLERWRAGDDVDGDGAPLAEQHRWQVELWRRLNASLNLPGPAERLTRLTTAVVGREEIAAALPTFVALFVPTPLPPAYLTALRVIATVRDVHLFVPCPSLTLPAMGGEGPATGNRLLRSWAHDSGEQPPLAADDNTREQIISGQRPRPTTLLKQIQADIAANVDRLTDDARITLATDDRSIAVHACHGRARQVDVLRDAILHELNDDPTLQPREILVLCPDLTAFAPLVDAAGLTECVLDRANAILAVIDRLLTLSDGRLTRSQVLDLAGQAPVRRKFSWDDEELEAIESWAIAAGVRWGIGPQQRRAFNLQDISTGSWSTAIDRLLTPGLLPLADVSTPDLAGRLSTYIRSLDRIVCDWLKPKPLIAWATALAAAADALTATTQQDHDQRLALTALLAQLADAAAGSEQPLSLAELRELLAPYLRDERMTIDRHSGLPAFHPLDAMPSIPYKVVCLLGLDDHAFPRRSQADGDDLLAACSPLGDHDRRTTDRRLLLDALLAAESRLIITYAGADERTGTTLPPAVPVGELLDAIDRTALPLADARAASAAVVVRHPPQAFDPRVFTAGALGRPGPFGHDRALLAGARALVADRPSAAQRPFLAAPLTARPTTTVTLDRLIEFFAAPVNTFLRRSLGIVLDDRKPPLSERIPIEPQDIDRDAIGQRLLMALRAGQDRATVIAAERARGTLPPGPLGDPPFRQLGYEVLTLIARADEALTGLPVAACEQLAAKLPDGRTLTGSVPGVHGDLIVDVAFAPLTATRRFAAWLRLLALTLAVPQRPLRSLVICGDRSAQIDILAATADERAAIAAAEIGKLVDLLARGLREPPPLAAATSEAFARGGHGMLARVQAAWSQQPRESQTPEHLLVYGGVAATQSLLSEPPTADELAVGFDPAAGSRFGAWARRAWAPLLARERIV